MHDILTFSALDRIVSNYTFAMFFFLLFTFWEKIVPPPPPQTHFSTLSYAVAYGVIVNCFIMLLSKVKMQEKNTETKIERL